MYLYTYINVIYGRSMPNRMTPNFLDCADTFISFFFSLFRHLYHGIFHTKSDIIDTPIYTSIHRSILTHRKTQVDKRLFHNKLICYHRHFIHLRLYIF